MLKLYLVTLLADYGGVTPVSMLAYCIQDNLGIYIMKHISQAQINSAGYFALKCYQDVTLSLYSIVELNPGVMDYEGGC